MRIKKTLIRLLVTTAMVALSGVGSAYSKGWEPAKEEKTTAHHVASDSEIEVKAGGGMIFISSSKQVNVQIFSILGSRIADDSLQPGFYRFVVPTHGVYIIKAGDLTCKVAV